MRALIALALLMAPAMAFAEDYAPEAPIPVHKCVQTTRGPACTQIRDGAGFAADNGYTRAHPAGTQPTQQASMTPTVQAPEKTR